MFLVLRYKGQFKHINLLLLWVAVFLIERGWAGGALLNGFCPPLKLCCPLKIKTIETMAYCLQNCDLLSSAHLPSRNKNVFEQKDSEVE